ncbi:hypothetical protein SmphiM6_96 [Sinorhizobium phage phiM6]|nr:hypothetical protein SmphiM6_96 [Sinorhizobium phage phiM6]
MSVARLFTDGTDLQVGDKIRLVDNGRSYRPYAAGMNPWGQFREIILLSEHFLHLKDHINPLTNTHWPVTRMKVPGRVGDFSLIPSPYIWEVQRNVVDYRVDQEPDENEETL